MINKNTHATRAQTLNINRILPGSKRAQEEMVGFAVIVIIVAIIMLFLLVFYIRSPQEEGVKSYEVNSFIQSFLHYTTDCEDYYGGMSIQKLIFECSNNKVCLNDGRNSCEALNSTLKAITKESWQVGQNRSVKGYEMKITTSRTEILLLKEGDVTNNYKTGFQNFASGRDSVNVSFKAYY